MLVPISENPKSVSGRSSGTLDIKKLL
jgi:hypothetical protein